MFRHDLSMEIEEWKNTGDQIVIMGDFNDKMYRRSPTKTMLEAHDMKEIILELHEGEVPPETYIRDTENKVIDGIWTSRGIDSIRGGYTEYGDFDHRTL
jgi:hypothetical protein